MIAMLNILFWFIIIYFSLSSLYLLILSFLGIIKYKELPIENTPSIYKRFAIFVPAFKEDSIIESTIEYLLKVEYPKDRFDIYLIADSLKYETLERLRSFDVKILIVQFVDSTKVKSLNFAFNSIEDKYDIALIVDADNILKRDFLKIINSHFNRGIKAVQGRRVAKNLDSDFAMLDAFSEGISNNIYRRGSNSIGLSSSIIGSGMAFDFNLLKNILGGIEAVSGFDKILQVKIVEQGIKIVYAQSAIIFDEKVGNSEAFKQQRKRWVSSQFIYLGKFMRPFLSTYLWKGNIDFFNLAILNNIILPRSFYLFLMPILAFLGYLYNVNFGLILFFVLITYILALVFAMPKELINRKLLVSLLKMPYALIIVISSIFKIKRTNKKFIHTVHTKNDVSTNLYEY